MFYHFQYFEHIEETEWAIEECLRSELPVILMKISLMVLAVDHNHNHNHNHAVDHNHANMMLAQVAATMCIGPEGDLHGNSAAECAIRMARAGGQQHPLHQDHHHHAYHWCLYNNHCRCPHRHNY